MPDSSAAPLDVHRIPPSTDVTATVEQVRLIEGLDNTSEVPSFLLDSGYDPVAVGHELADVAGAVPCRIRDDRVSTPTCRHGPPRPWDGHRFGAPVRLLRPGRFSCDTQPS